MDPTLSDTRNQPQMSRQAGRRPTRKTITTDHPRWDIQITDDGTRTLIDREGKVGFHSAAGAITETRSVYLENSGVAARLQRCQTTAVLEVGLGTSMALLVTLDAAAKAGASLRYLALEAEWLPAGLVRQLGPADWVSDPQLAEHYLTWRNLYPDRPAKGDYHWQLDERREVRVRICDVTHDRWQPSEIYDAVYFDPFAPDVDDTLWSTEVLAWLHSLLRRNGRLVTYCVSRSVRERMAAVGFSVSVVDGPRAGKRNVLVAERLD